mgnify:CR=1 FL=1
MFDEFGNAPEGWEIRQLDELAESITSGGTPKSGSSRYYTSAGGLPFAKTEDLSRASSKHIESCELQITEAALKDSAAKPYPEGTILVSMYGTIGLTKITAREMAANQALCALLAPFSCNADFLYHQLDFIRPKWSQFSGQTTQANISGSIVRKAKVLLPPRNEQSSIAFILDTLDTQIQKTEALIAKLEKVKEGLLHDLLTRGIDEHGQLRPRPEQAPELYKESPLGLIPREWSSPLLDEVAIRGSGHTPSRSNPAFWDGGVSWVSLSDSKSLDNVWIEKTEKTISELGVANSSAVIHPAGTVVLSRDAGIGKSGITKSEMAVSQHFMAWRCGKDLDNLFLYYWLQWMKPRFEAIALGSTIQTIGLRYFERLRIPTPSFSEQKAISSILLGINERIWKEKATRAKALSEKSGLMDDLLTGRVRVTPLLDQAQITTPA